MDIRLVIAAQGLAGITATECGVLVALATCRDHRTGICNPTLDRVAAMSHYTKRSVINAVDSLIGKELLAVEKEPGKHGKRNRYTFRLAGAVVEKGALGERGSPKTGERGSPKGVNVVHLKIIYIKIVCVRGAHTHRIS